MLWYDIIYTYMYTHIYWLILGQRWVCGRWVTNQLEPWDMMGMTSRNWEVMFTYFIIYIYIYIYIYDMYNICSGIYIYILGYMDNYSEDRDGDDTAWASWQKGMKLVIPRSCYMTETTSTYRKSFSRNHHKSPLRDDGDDDRLRISGWQWMTCTGLGLEHVSNIIGIGTHQQDVGWFLKCPNQPVPGSFCEGNPPVVRPEWDYFKLL